MFFITLNKQPQTRKEIVMEVVVTSVKRVDQGTLIEGVFKLLGEYVTKRGYYPDLGLNAEQKEVFLIRKTVKTPVRPVCKQVLTSEGKFLQFDKIDDLVTYLLA